MFSANTKKVRLQNIPRLVILFHIPGTNNSIIISTCTSVKYILPLYVVWMRSRWNVIIERLCYRIHYSIRYLEINRAVYLLLIFMFILLLILAAEKSCSCWSSSLATPYCSTVVGYIGKNSTQHQQTSTNINKHQQTSTNINKHQQTSTHFYWTSICKYVYV